MKFVDYSGKNAKSIYLKHRRFKGIREPTGNVLGEVHLPNIGKADVIATCDDIKIYKVGTSTLQRTVGYLVTDSGEFVSVKSSALFLFLIPIVLAAILIPMTIGNPIPSVPVNTVASSTSSGTVMSSGSDVSDLNSNGDNSGNSEANGDIETGTPKPDGTTPRSRPSVPGGEISPNQPDNVVASKLDAVTRDYSYWIQFRSKPRYRDGKLNIRFINDSTNKVSSSFDLVTGSTTIYKSGTIKPGQYVENATIKNVANISDLKIVIYYLNDNGVPYSNTAPYPITVKME